ncbi:MAG TPA: HEAT repeat domain-containing protein [Rectinemataceae bacterium]|nr:HEAT repeat domain-containing protein [Rectinemataceae bacterium]
MKFLARCAYAAFLCVIALPFAAAQAQTQPASQAPASSSTNGEKTVEEAYLQESLETMIIKEQAHSDSRDTKEIALQYARQAIDAGRKNNDIRDSLEYLALETTDIISRQAGLGQPTNNFPDIRAKACDYLGDFPSVSAKNALIKVVLGDNEPMVIAAAVRSLGKIGLNENNEVTQDIAFIVNRYNVLGPDNSLAFECLVAIQRLADKNGGLNDPTAIRAVMQIDAGNYITPVKTMAEQVLNSLRKYQVMNSSK